MRGPIWAFSTFTSTAVAELLMGRGIPILFHCGRLPLHLRYPGVPVCFKPIPAADLVIEIARLLGRSGIH
jgi:hypothetical protein